jgi:hypothetical protein
MGDVLSNLLDSLLYFQDQNYCFYLFFEEKYNKHCSQTFLVCCLLALLASVTGGS